MLVCWKVDYEEEDRLMMEVMVCGEVDRPDSSAYANAQGVPLLVLASAIVPH